MLKSLIKKIIPPFLISSYHFFLAFLGALVYRFPSCPPKFSFGKFRRARKINPVRDFGNRKKVIKEHISNGVKVLGITGTNGKSTVVDLVGRILEEAGYKTAAISSIKFKIAEKEWQNELKMTMPGRFNLQRFLRKALNAGCQYVVLEVTSEGILQHRHCFINFETAVFTNLSAEHIERHGSFEKYRQAKGKLFKSCKKIHILNIDDKNSNYFLEFPAKEKILFSILSPKNRLIQRCKLVEAKDIKEFGKGISFRIKEVDFNINLIGRFNVYNCLAAICTALSQGIDLKTSKRALEKVKIIPGRMEIVIEKPFQVIVDYAHTPDSLEKVYQTTRNQKSEKYKLICVLGACGGGRDKWKRPKMGEIAAKYCDEIILTNEDPYDEPPQNIIDQIEEGISANHFNQYKSAVIKILDRREAIRKALGLAQPGNIAIITGKGSEPWMCIAHGKKVPWNDREIVREEFNKLNPVRNL